MDTMQGSLSQLVTNFYGPLDHTSLHSRPARADEFEEYDQFDLHREYHGYDDEVGDWTQGYKDPYDYQEDDYYGDDRYSHDYNSTKMRVTISMRTMRTTVVQENL